MKLVKKNLKLLYSIQGFSGIVLSFLASIIGFSDQTKLLSQGIPILIVAIILWGYSNYNLKKLAWADGLATGYFYNFLYEIANFIADNKATIKLDNKPITFTKEDIILLVVVPNNLHGDYRLSEIISTIFQKIEIIPSDPSLPQRGKFLKGFIAEVNNAKKLILIDTPPTTIRSIKLFKESEHKVSHYKHYNELNDFGKSQAEFNKILKQGKKDSESFKIALSDLIEVLSDNKDQLYKDLIKIKMLDEITKGIILKDDYSELECIGDNEGVNNQNIRNNIKLLVQNKSEQLKTKITTIIQQ